MCKVAEKCDLGISPNDFEYFRLGRAKPEQSKRPVVVQFKSSLLKMDLMRDKAKAKEFLKAENIKICEDLTKAWRIVLGVIRKKFPSAHSRNGTPCFFDSNNRLVFVRTPNILFQYGFEVEEIKTSENAFLA